MNASAVSEAHPETMQLSADRRQAILDATIQLLRASTLGEPAPHLPADVAEVVVSGSFVSLKRGKHLRGCCGGLQSQPGTLGDILPNAVERTVGDDPRFPPVSPGELPYLDAEVWLLFNPQHVAAHGQDRARHVVTGGKHGVVVRWGEQRGLLLPGVAVEHGWDSETFLDHVCLKAGLHPSRWRDDDTQLLTFEGVAVRGPIGGEKTNDYRFLNDEHIREYTAFCRENLAALLDGGTPRYTAPHLPDATVSGLMLSLDPGTGEAPWQVSKIDVRRGVALQASLFQLTQAFSTHLAQMGACDADLERLNLAVFYDPHLHGDSQLPDLRGVATGRRAVLLVERHHSSLIYDADQPFAESLREAAQQLGTKASDAAAVFSLAVDASQPRLVHAVRPRPHFGAEVRPAAVAGAFYPGDPQALQALVEESLGPIQPTAPWSAALVPHAGLRFSGKVAGAVFRRLAIPSTVIILGPKHTPHGMDWSIAPCKQWSIPGAKFDADPTLAKRLTEAIPGLELDAAAHHQEHCIEVELPFLARLAPQSRIVGIALGQATYAECEQFAEGFATVLREMPEPPLLLISSDMNHFASDTATRRLDDMALACLDRLDAESLYETCRNRHITMCGMIPAVIVLETLRRLGKLQRADRVAYATSADMTGQPERVVGYAGMVFGA
jgi:AmmeMemoRadiSam system protein B/AmmeMemoRadiSam system protein A